MRLSASALRMPDNSGWRRRSTARARHAGASRKSGLRGGAGDTARFRARKGLHACRGRAQRKQYAVTPASLRSAAHPGTWHTAGRHSYTRRPLAVPLALPRGLELKPLASPASGASSASSDGIETALGARSGSSASPAGAVSLAPSCAGRPHASETLRHYTRCARLPTARTMIAGSNA